MPDKDELDLLLDSALATYADPGPDSGLEQRVLTALAGARPGSDGRRKRWWLAWAIAAPVAASLVLWISILIFNRTPSRPAQQAYQPAVPSERAGPSPLAPPTPPTDEHAVLKEHEISRAANAAYAARASAPQGRHIPKLDVFPSPQPLTAEEKTLVAAAASPSVEVKAALQASQTPSEVPLSIAALDIPPLASYGESQK